MYTQQLKNEIITALDVLPVESLEILAQYVTFLKGQVIESLPSSTTVSSVMIQSDNPLMQLGRNPIDDDMANAPRRNYTKEPSQWLGNPTLDEIASDIKKIRNI